MNLHQIAGPIVGVVNPQIPIELRRSAGSTEEDSGARTPLYQSPASIVGSISGTTLTVVSVSGGVVAVGQTLEGTGVIAGTLIVGLGTGSGAEGTYEVSRQQEAAEQDVTARLIVRGQVQPLSYRDLAQVDSLNMNGVKWKVYLNGQADGVVRLEEKGGDLVVISSGPHAGTWLVVMILEQWPGWACAAIVLQNDS